MQIESTSAYVARLIGWIVVVEAGLLALAALVCWLFSQPTLASFSTVLFVIGCLALFLSRFLGRDVILLPGAFAQSGGQRDPRTVLDGSVAIRWVGGGAGALAIVLSLLIGLFFAGPLSLGVR